MNISSNLKKTISLLSIIYASSILFTKSLEAYSLKLHRAWPNPSNPTEEQPIKLGFEITPDNDADTLGTRLELKIYNIRGQLVRSLIDNNIIWKPDLYNIQWDGKNKSGKNVAPGVYFYTLKDKQTKNYQTRKLVILK